MCGRVLGSGERTLTLALAIVMCSKCWSLNVDTKSVTHTYCLDFVGDSGRALDGSGQNLERRYHLEIWRETVYWMETRCSDLQELDREGDAASIYMEFRLKGIG